MEARQYSFAGGIVMLASCFSGYLGHTACIAVGFRPQENVFTSLPLRGQRRKSFGILFLPAILLIAVGYFDLGSWGLVRPQHTKGHLSRLHCVRVLQSA
jgi:hypothetical protein